MKKILLLTTIFILMSSFAFAACPTEMVSYWQLDGDATDSAGSSTGTVYGGATFGTGVVNNAINLDGIDVNPGQYIDVPINEFRYDTQGTICTWFKVDQHKSYNTIFVFGYSGSPYYYMYIDILPAGALRIQHRELSTMHWNFHTDETINPINVNEWYHLCLSQDGAPTLPSVYLDGEKITTFATSSGSTPGAWFNEVESGNRMYIGKWRDHQNHLDGSIDEFTIYNRSLTPGEVRELYNASKQKHKNYCQIEPIATKFDSKTNFNNEADLTQVSNMFLAKDNGIANWTNDVNAVAEDLDKNVNIGSDFVSVNDSGIDSSLISPVKVTLSVTGCPATIYYAPGFHDSLASIKADPGVVECNALSSPACTNINCAGNTLNYEIEHLDGTGAEENQEEGQTVPEFSTLGLILSIAIIAIGGYLVAIKTKK